MDVKIKLQPETRGFFKTFELYPVYEDWQGELYNYFIKGYSPGSFHTALFANDLTRAAFRTHVMNEWAWIASFVKWNFANAPSIAIGSYENVDHWLGLSEKKRRKICEGRGWMLTEEEITWAIVSDKG